MHHVNSQLSSLWVQPRETIEKYSLLRNDLHLLEPDSATWVFSSLFCVLQAVIDKEEPFLICYHNLISFQHDLCPAAPELARNG